MSYNNQNRGPVEGLKRYGKGKGQVEVSGPHRGKVYIDSSLGGLRVRESQAQL